jgi:ribosomal protein S18 acetylase RimI-like enzyme
VATINYERFARHHLDGVIELCRGEGWDSYLQDRERTFRALSAPGVITIVVTNGGAVCGFAQILTDGEIRAYLTDVAVSADARRQGIGTRLIEEAFARAGARYLDLLSDPSLRRCTSPSPAIFACRDSASTRRRLRAEFRTEVVSFGAAILLLSS